MWLGPNAVLALGREGYRRHQVSLGDLVETVRTRGFRRLARKHLRMGLGEIARDYEQAPLRGGGPEAAPGARGAAT